MNEADSEEHLSKEGKRNSLGDNDKHSSISVKELLPEVDQLVTDIKAFYDEGLLQQILEKLDAINKIRCSKELELVNTKCPEVFKQPKSVEKTTSTDELCKGMKSSVPQHAYIGSVFLNKIPPPLAGYRYLQCCRNTATCEAVSSCCYIHLPSMCFSKRRNYEENLSEKAYDCSKPVTFEDLITAYRTYGQSESIPVAHRCLWNMICSLEYDEDCCCDFDSMTNNELVEYFPKFIDLLRSVTFKDDEISKCLCFKALCHLKKLFKILKSRDLLNDDQTRMLKLVEDHFTQKSQNIKESKMKIPTVLECLKCFVRLIENGEMDPTTLQLLRNEEK